MRLQKIISTLTVLALVIAVAGCGALTPSANPGSSTGGSPSLPISGTSAASSGGGVLIGPGSQDSTPTTVDLTTALVADATGSLAVTQADNGRTVMMQVGQRFLLNLGETYDWTFSIDDQSIVSRVVNIVTIRGSQGIFEAHQNGTTVLHAAGDPPCRQTNPPCMMPSVDFQITITVQ